MTSGRLSVLQLRDEKTWGRLLERGNMTQVIDSNQEHTTKLRG